MKCPYSNPTTKQCLNCTVPGGCVKTNSKALYDSIEKWKKNNPDKVKKYRHKTNQKFWEEHKEEEVIRVAKWKKENKKKAKKIQKRANKKYYQTHKEQEKIRNRLNYLKRKERVS